MAKLRLLSTFVRIADRGSISAAARDLSLSQASASRQLAQLEALLGATLVLRTTHDLSLTETGRAVLSQARILLAQWEELTDIASEDDNASLSGAMRVVAPVALGRRHLSVALMRFVRNHPNINITWLLSDEEQRVAEAGLDLWIRIGQPEDENLIVEQVATVERLLVSAKPPGSAHPTRFDQPCIAMNLFEGEQIILQNSENRTVSLRADIALRVNDIFALRDAVLEGVGAAILPRWMIEEELARGRLHDCLPGWRAAELPITLAYLPVMRHSRRLTALRDAMRIAIQSINGLEPVPPRKG